MMLINPPGQKEMIVYADTLTEALCPGTEYEFSAYILNVSIPKNCSNSTPPLPKFSLSVETLAGATLNSTNTGNIGYSYDTVFTPKFGFYSVRFTMPAGLSQLVLKIKSLDYGFVPCEFPFAIDDIQLAATGPKAAINFSDAVGLETVKQICFSANESVAFNGEVGAFYPDTRYQWQQSTNNGASWEDIPGATNPVFSKSFPVADTILFRLSAGDASNIGNVNCRVVSNVLKVEVNGVPTNLHPTSNSPVCVGVDVLFDAQTEGVIYYEWHGPNNFYDNAYYPSVNHTELKDSGMYYVTITTTGGCRFTDSTYVKVYGMGAVTAGNDTAICIGRSVQLHASPGARIRWTPVSSLSDSTIADPVATPLITTDYTVKVTDNTACIASAKVRVTVLNKTVVKAIFTAPAFLCRPSDTATFTNTSQGDITNWYWNFSNGQVSTEKDPPTVRFLIPNDLFAYNISLAVKDSAGCTDTTWHKIQVADNCYIAVPSAFTPNGDGKNDFLYPVNAYKATNLLFRVYNRNGHIVFQTKDWTHKWDGRIKGELQPTGVYVWTLEYTDSSQKRITQKGTVTLIR